MMEGAWEWVGLAQPSLSLAKSLLMSCGFPKTPDLTSRDLTAVVAGL